MEYTACQQHLLEAYTRTPRVRESFSALTSEARWSHKRECLVAFDNSPASVMSFVQDEISHYESDGSWMPWGDEVSASVAETTTNTIGSSTSDFFSGIDMSSLGVPSMGAVWWVLRMIMRFVLAVVAVILLWKLIKYVIAFLYDVLNAHRIVYLKVLLPRGDSKMDREQSKELAKDMKEKIWRMSQIYTNLHKLGDLSLGDSILAGVFDKPKVTLMLHYEEDQLYFIIGTYPEYVDIVEGALSAQFADLSVEGVQQPNMFGKKHSYIVPLQPEKEAIYPIRMYTQMKDDPLNNLIDSMANVKDHDTFTVVLPIKPVGSAFNKKAKVFSDALYKRDESVTNKKVWRQWLLPWTWIAALINGPSDSLKNGDKWWYVRMVKSEEDALNAMAEEASYPAFRAGLMLISSSDDGDEAHNNILNMVGTMSIYNHEYNNELEQPEMLVGLLGGIMRPLWKFAAQFHLVNFFFKPNVFSINEMTSLFHLPDGVYNRSPVVKWMDYKMLAPPDNLPEFGEESGYIISGMVAEWYKWGKLNRLLSEEYKDHWAVGVHTHQEPSFVPYTKGDPIPDGAEVVDKDGQQMIKTMVEKNTYGYKVFHEGILLGVNVYRNEFSPVYMKRDDRTRHHYIVGKSGTGKSVYLHTLARQDIWNGDGCCIIDPHGDLVEDVLEYIPKERAKDVVIFDAGDEQRPMWLNLYEIDSINEADRAVNDATEMFIKMFGPEIFWPRIQEYFKFGSLTLLEDMNDKPTLLDVPRLFTDDGYREIKTKNLQNPVVKNFWDKTYASMGDREKQEIIPYFTSKFVSFNTNALIRNIIGQSESAFDIADIMNNQKILLINLSKGKIGELNAQLLGMILVSKIYNAAMSRASMPKNDRKDFYLYVDEFQNFISSTFGDILSEARKYRLSLVMAHQFIAQLEQWSGNNIGEKKGGVKDAVFGNVGTMQSFKVGAPDAEFLEKEYTPVLSASDIVWIANYKAYVKLNIDNTTTRPFSMTSIYTQDYRNKDIARILKEYSAKKYGRKKEFVDAEIQAKLGLWVDEEHLHKMVHGDAWSDAIPAHTSEQPSP